MTNQSVLQWRRREWTNRVAVSPGVISEVIDKLCCLMSVVHYQRLASTLQRLSPIQQTTETHNVFLLRHNVDRKKKANWDKSASSSPTGVTDDIFASQMLLVKHSELRTAAT